MDILELIQMQRELDKICHGNAGLTYYPTEYVKVALLVELAELANEAQFFKFWKQNKHIDKKKILEEYADCLHFALSLAYHCEYFNS